MLYLYALSEPPTETPSRLGVDDTPVTVEHLDVIDAVVSVVDREHVEPAEAAVLAHAGVVDELASRNAAVLPVRFGRGYANVDALRGEIAERSRGLTAALERVRDCCELGLRVLGRRDDGAPSGGSGRDYMRSRLQTRQRAERLAEELHAPLASLARAETHSVGATPELLLSAAYLVPRDTVESFRATVSELARGHPELTVACTGPWPPYSFAAVAAGARE